MNSFHASKCQRTLLVEVKIADDIIMDSDYHCRVGDACYYKPSSKMKIPTQSTSKYFLFKSALFTHVQGSNKYRSWISLLLLVMITSTVRF